MPNRPTHRFVATWKGKLAGVVVMATPNAFSHLLGVENAGKEKLISRGACISWAPKNLNSALVMFAIRWMVKNTEFRFFTAYSDVEARELGTIYQACNFHYLGQEAGARFEYFDPACPEKGWFSDRLFRKQSSYKAYAKKLRIEWKSEWIKNDRLNWQAMPEAAAKLLRDESRRHQENCQRRAIPRKHKYVYILGRTKKETKRLKNRFSELNQEKSNLAYPKIRGPQKLSAGIVEEGPLTIPSEVVRPTSRYLNVKEVAAMYGISIWTIYELIKTDSSFPYRNIGIKKKFVVNPDEFETWMTERTKKERQKEMHVPSAEELLKTRRSYA